MDLQKLPLVFLAEDNKMKATVLKTALYVLLEIEKCVDRAIEQVKALEQEEKKEPFTVEK